MVRLRQRSSLSCTDCEHFIVLSGNARTRSLELFVVLFAAHVFAFRLTKEWAGGDTVLWAVNGIMKDAIAPRLEKVHATPLPVTAPSVAGTDQNQFTLLLDLHARAKGYWFRHSAQARKTIRDGIKHCGTLDKTVSKMLEELYRDSPDDFQVKEQCVAIKGKIDGRMDGVVTDEQVETAANALAQAIDCLASKDIFPPRYD